MPSVKDPHNVQIGSQAVTDVLSIDWGEDRVVINGRADDDVYDTIAEFGGATVSGGVTFRDPAQAAAFADQSGSLSATFTGLGGGADKTLTITNCSTGGVRNAVGHDGMANATVPFAARSSDGATSPISYA
ncbi:hypothetical protein LCGC14_3001120 [marine sediment metagenome]|uniref:Uncharacterized protein n=1 Tax=marine sediment metagenome TaxID=412755 RepID=A0A0F8X0X4_9ZZZZ